MQQLDSNKNLKFTWEPKNVVAQEVPFFNCHDQKLSLLSYHQYTVYFIIILQ